MLGVLSVMDIRKRTLDPLQEELFDALGRMAGGLLDRGSTRPAAAAMGPALAAASARLKGVLEHADVLIYIKNAQGRFVLANRAVERQLGRERGRMLGALQRDLFPEEIAADHLRHDAQVREEGSPMVFEERAPHPDGTLHDFVTTKFPLPDAEGHMSLVGAVGATASSASPSPSTRRRPEWPSSACAAPIAGASCASTARCAS
jgi:diguanylate cyclase